MKFSNDKGSPVSASNLTTKVESEILKAFKAIHSYGVLHGDVRADNILISEVGNTVWIVDFEFAEIIKEDDVKESKISQEIQVVKELLNELKNYHVIRTSHQNLTSNLSQNEL